MSELARAAVDGAKVYVGDEVLVRGVVRRSSAGIGALVRFTSKTDHYEGWIHEDDLWIVHTPRDLAGEPADGTWLLVDGSTRPDGNPLIFNRDDAEGHFDDDRRYQQHWFDVVAQEWIDWPSALARGAAGAGVRRMIVKEDT